jgi:hypothetical protein
MLLAATELRPDIWIFDPLSCEGRYRAMFRVGTREKFLASRHG